MFQFYNNQEQLSHIIKDLLNLNSRLHILSSFQFHLIQTEFHSVNVIIIFLFVFRMSSTNSFSPLFPDAGRFWNTMLDWMLNSSFLINYVSSSVIWLRAPSSLSFVSSSFLFLAFISSSKSFLTYPIFAHYSYPQRCNKISKICLMSGIISSNNYKRYNTDKKRVKIGQNETCSEPGVCFSVELFNQI